MEPGFEAAGSPSSQDLGPPAKPGAVQHELRDFVARWAKRLNSATSAKAGAISDIAIADFEKNSTAAQRAAVSDSIKIEALSGLALIEPFSISKAISATR